MLVIFAGCCKKDKPFIRTLNPQKLNTNQNTRYGEKKHLVKKKKKKIYWLTTNSPSYAPYFPCHTFSDNKGQPRWVDPSPTFPPPGGCRPHKWLQTQGLCPTSDND